MIHAQRSAISAGTTAEAYGTVVNTDLQKNAKRVLAILALGVDPTYTTAEGAAGLLRVNARSIGISNEVFPVGPFTNSGPATNSGSTHTIIDVVDLDWHVTGGERIAIDIAPSVTITTARLYEVAVLWSDEKSPPGDWLDKFPLKVRSMGCQVDAAQQLTTTRTALAALTIPAWAREIIAYKAWLLKEGAITAAEEGLGYFEVTSSIPNVAPLELPSCNAYGATLGTPVDHFNPITIPWVPIHIPGTGGEETITPFVILRTAITTGNNAGFAVAYR